MTISSKPRGRKRDMIELLSDANNPLGDTGCIANVKAIELNSNEIWKFNDISLQEIDDNNDIRKRYRNLSSRYRE